MKSTLNRVSTLVAVVLIRLIPEPIYFRIRRLFLGSYYRFVHLNYHYELRTITQRTVIGPIRTYELYNRHGRDRMLQEIDALCDETSLIVDVGANVGIYACALANKRPDRNVIAVEPVPSVVEKLRKNIARNQLTDQITVIAGCLGEKSGNREFFVSSYTELSSTKQQSAERWEARVTNSITVRQYRLDDICETKSPDVIKIDVEGAAADVLAGGTSILEHAQPAIVLEVHTEGLTEKEPTACRRILESYEYAVTEFEDFWVAKPTGS